jgi:2-hydroxychromene-2-carboxylate isomerase
VTLRAQLSRTLTTTLTSRTSRRARRLRAALAQRFSGKPATVHYFHQADDPYSHLCAQILASFTERYRVALEPHLVPPPDDAAAPERARLKAYARRDAARLANRYGLVFAPAAQEPSPERIRWAQSQLAWSLVKGSFVSVSVSIGSALWSGAPNADATQASFDAERMISDGDALRKKLGHYLGGMFYFEGEWYWGIDRLHHLEARLRQAGLAKDPDTAPMAPFQDMQLDGPRTTKPLTIEFWFSFRSPYSWIAAPRLHRLAAHYGANVRWRFILPMVMRGLPVPRIKSLYIVFDVKREAEVLNLPFGTVVDPVGRGAERALAVLNGAIAKGRGGEFSESGLKAAFADGIDLASDKGILRAATRAGLTEDDVKAALADPSWRDVAEENRKALFEAGLWGAPAYRVGDMPAHWGQDRLWALEEDLKSLIASSG